MSSKSNLLGPTGSDEDVWDDTELIREYDKAVKSWRKSREGLAKEGAEEEAPPGPGPWKEVSSGRKETNLAACSNLNGNNSALTGMSEGWAVGSPCRAIYSGDNNEYEAKIVELKWPMCTIRFVGYGNEESSAVHFLKPSKGKKFRDQQRRDAVEYRHNLNGGELDIADIADCFSNASLSSSMFNNCGDTVLGRDIDETMSSSVLQDRPPLQASTPNPKAQILKSNLKVLETLEIPNKIPPPNHPIGSDDAVDGASAVPPSAAEATIASSSTSDLSSVDADPAQELPTNITNMPTSGNWENFNNSMPHITFPVPPLPLSFANPDGAFNFSRGELPSLLMSWYMAGYQSGFFDAKREFASARNRNRSGGCKKKN